MNIKDSVIVITGGASGLGEGCVKYLAGLGAYVAIFDIQEESGNKLVEALSNNKVIFIKTDVTDESSCLNAFNEVKQRFGACQIVINCAGVAIAKKLIGKKGEHDSLSFEKVMKINIQGTFNVSKFSAKQMIEEGNVVEEERGLIINTASVAAFDGQIGQVAYSASKGAVVSMTLPLARELAASHIRVVAIAPGIFETPMMAGLPEKAQKELAASVPFPKRLGKTEEFAKLVAAIIENPMINGEVIRLDGAIRMS